MPGAGDNIIAVNVKIWVFVVELYEFLVDSFWGLKCQNDFFVLILCFCGVYCTLYTFASVSAFLHWMHIGDHKYT